MKLNCLILILIISSCKTIKQSPIEIIDIPYTPKIVFLNCKILKHSDNTISISLINKIIAEGNLKVKGNEDNLKIDGNLECAQLDGNSLSLESLSMPNPLVKNVEYIDSSGSLSMKQISLDSTDFMIRMQLNSATKFVQLGIVGDAKSRPLKIEI